MSGASGSSHEDTGQCRGRGVRGGYERRVDPATLQVLESPGQPRTDHRFLTRVYVVGANLRVTRGRSPPTADDAELTKEVASHVAGLVFRPALLADRVIRSTVLVSCQTF